MEAPDQKLILLKFDELCQALLEVPEHMSHTVGLLIAVITIAFIMIMSRVKKRGKKKLKTKAKAEIADTITENDEGIDAEFDQINLHLQDGLKSCIAEKVEEARKEILTKQKEMEGKIAKSKSDKEDELAVVESKYLADKEEIEEKYMKEISKVRNTFMSEIYEMKETIQSMKIVLACSNEPDEEIVEKSRSELECPVCLEEMRPPRRIWQCSDGHPLCENCRKKPEMNTCPTCRKYLVGRSTIAEKLARALYAPEEPENVNGAEEFNGEEERKSKKIKLF